MQMTQWNKTGMNQEKEMFLATKILKGTRLIRKGKF